MLATHASPCTCVSFIGACMTSCWGAPRAQTPRCKDHVGPLLRLSARVPPPGLRAAGQEGGPPTRCSSPDVCCCLQETSSKHGTEGHPFSQEWHSHFTGKHKLMHAMVSTRAMHFNRPKCSQRTCWLAHTCTSAQAFTSGQSPTLAIQKLMQGRNPSAGSLRLSHLLRQRSMGRQDEVARSCNSELDTLATAQAFALTAHCGSADAALNTKMR